MSIRYLKIILVVFVGLAGLLFVAGNIANWDAGLELVGYVVGMEGHEIYGSHILPPVTNPALVAVAFSSSWRENPSWERFLSRGPGICGMQEMGAPTPLTRPRHTLSWAPEWQWLYGSADSS